VRTARDLPDEHELPNDPAEADSSVTDSRSPPGERRPVLPAANPTIQDAIDRLYQKLKDFPR
jgi:hypothetical protein